MIIVDIVIQVQFSPPTPKKICFKFAKKEQNLGNESLPVFASALFGRKPNWLGFWIDNTLIRLGSILMSDTGGGHRASAKAIAAALDKAMPGQLDITILDVLA